MTCQKAGCQRMENDEYITDTMKRFKPVDMRERYPELIQEAEKTQISYREFLINLLRAEDEGKNRRRQERLLDHAGFEYIKTLDQIDYSFNPSLNPDKIRELGTLRFLDAGENVLIVGPPGVGKTMIATGIGIQACSTGRKVLFVNTNDLMDHLTESMQNGTLKETFAELQKIPLLIIDELPYLKMDKEKESLFFQVVRQRYEKSSLIITTNLPPGRWDEIFTGKIAAAAILDRLVHHCHVISITGDSYRVKGEK